jgi:hypothetical protein
MAVGFLSATAEDHVDVDLGDIYVGDIELDEDLDIVVQLDVDVWVDNVRLDVAQILIIMYSYISATLIKLRTDS